MPTSDQHDKRTLTAKDIAEAIRFRKDRNGFAKSLRQIKHWTANGLLQTTTPLETGRGVAREYVDIPTVFIAAVLQELALYGLTIEALKPVADQLYEDYENGDPDWIHFVAETAEFNGYLNIELEADTHGRLSISQVSLFSEHPDAEPGAQRMPQSSGSIMLNVVKVMERVTWPSDQ